MCLCIAIKQPMRIYHLKNRRLIILGEKIRYRNRKQNVNIINISTENAEMEIADVMISLIIC